ncbi:hypothetical protein ES703_37822 [subsurface metagenome]
MNMKSIKVLVVSVLVGVMLAAPLLGTFAFPLLLVGAFVLAFVLDHWGWVRALGLEFSGRFKRRLRRWLIFTSVLFVLVMAVSCFVPGFEVNLPAIGLGMLLVVIASTLAAMVEERIVK